LITREAFLAYEKVRRSGATNMFDFRVVMELTGLTRAQVLEIMKTYQRLRREYLTDVLKEGK
jgi:hypothetical protein